MADELFPNALQSFETCLSVSHNLYGKLFSSLYLLMILDDTCRVTSVALFITDWNFLSCELDNFIFKLLYWKIGLIK